MKSCVISRSGNIKRVEVTVMFPEGMTLSDMANRLEENNVCKAGGSL